MSTEARPIPRLPVFGWAALRGGHKALTPSLLDLPHMHFTTSGRASILLALEALGVGAGERVLLPTYHCPTMVAPAVALGATPLFYPTDGRGSPDLAWIEGQDLHGVRVMLVAHFFGLPQPMAGLRRWCDARCIALLEDCAHALFGRSGERPIGAWGDMAIASLTKFLPVPEGGCLVVNRGVAPSMLSARSARAQVKAAINILEEGARHGRLTGLNGLILRPLDTLRGLRASPPPAKEFTDGSHDKVRDDSTVDVTQAHRALSRPNRWVAQYIPRARVVQLRRQRYAALTERLAGHVGLRPLLPTLPPDCAPYMFPLWVDAPDPGYAELRRLCMPVYRWDRLWPDTPHLPGDSGIEWSHHVLQLACHQDLTDADADCLIDTLLRVYVMPSPTSDFGAPTALTAIAQPPMQVSVDAYRHPDEIPAEVQQLFAQAEGSNIELGLVWFRTLVQNVFAGEKDVRFLVLRHAGAPVAVLPVSIEKRAWSRRSLALSNYYTALYTPLLAPGLQPAELLPLIRAAGGVWGGSASMRFAPMDPESAAYRTLRAALKLAGLRPFAYFCFGNWHLPCAQSGWREYLASRSAGLRSTIKRLGKKFEADGGSFEIVTSEGRLSDGITAFERVYAARWKRPEPYPQFLPDLIHACAHRGWLRLGLAWLNGQPVAAQLWIVGAERAEIYKVAYDEAFKQYSPGTLLTAHLLQHVIEEDRVAEVDYLIGDDAYKETWMSHRRERWGLVAYNPRTISGLLGLAIEWLGRAAKPWVGSARARFTAWSTPSS